MKKIICDLEYDVRTNPIYFTFQQKDNRIRTKASKELVKTLKQKDLLLAGNKFVVEIFLDKYKVRAYDIAKDGDINQLTDYLHIIEECKNSLSLDEYKIMKKEVLQDIERIKNASSK